MDVQVHSVRVHDFAGGALARVSARLPLRILRRATPLRLAAACVCTTVALLAVITPRAALSLLIVQLVVALWLLKPELGLAGLWTVWLVISGARRVLDASLPIEGYDPLSLAPFAATAAIAALEMLRLPLPAKPERVMMFAILGLAFGVPMGAQNPTALAFALFAYGAGVLAFAIGYAEGRRSQRLDTASRSLAPLLAPLALYGIAQYVLPLPAWDQRWVRESGLTSILVPGDVEHVRVFSALNSPATFGAVLAIGLVVLLARDKLKPGAIAATALGLVALALTYVRMAIPALALGLLVFAAASRWRAAPRLAAFAAIVTIATIGLGATTPVGSLVLDRVTSLGSLGADTSANERQATLWEVLPDAALAPLGHGIGSAGEPSKLSGPTSFEAAVDNGYLGLLYQLGPLGFSLVAIALVSAVAQIVRARPPTAALRRGRQLDLALVATLAVLAAATDVFYGVLGALLWFFLGHGLAVCDWPPPAHAGTGLAKHSTIHRQVGHG
jgi:O-Antigen ligase